MRTRGCGHGECTTADTPCRYETPECAPKLPARAPEDLGGWSRDESPSVRWHPNDLDRCEHGRHSADHCYDCPGGHSLGNRFLTGPRTAETSPRTRYVEGRLEVRIGTMVRGEPIWVVVRDKPREASVTEEEADGKLPCMHCGHRVRPGRHSLEQCAENQRADAAGDDPADIDKEQNDGE